MLLNKEEVKQKLLNLKDQGWDWDLQACPYTAVNSLHTSIRAKNYVDALNMVNSFTPIAEKLNHHPNIYIHSYRTIDLYIYTHNLNGITDKDFELAIAIMNLRKQSM